MVNLGWLPWTTAKTVYPRPTMASTKRGLIASWAENQPPLTTKITPRPLEPAFGRNTSMVRAVPYLRP